MPLSRIRLEVIKNLGSNETTCDPACRRGAAPTRLISHSELERGVGVKGEGTSSLATSLVRPAGRYGCILEATTARIYNQFTNFALASLIYDFVVVEWIRGQTAPNVDGQDIPGIIASMSAKFVDLGICIDPWDVAPFPTSSLDLAQFDARYPNATQAQRNFYCEFGRIYAATHGLLGKKLEERSRGEHVEGLHQYVSLAEEIERVFHRFLFKTGITSLGYDLDDGRALDDGISDKFNDLLRPLVRKGRIPLVGCGEETSPVIRQEEAVRILQLFVRAVPFPSDMPADEFADFRNSKAVRRSIGKFRELAGNLVGPQAPASYVIEELVEQYQTYKAEVERMKTRTHFNNIKFCLTSLAGGIEDILKLRLESLAKRPFEIAEWFADKKYSYKDYEASPFFFVIEKDVNMPTR